MIGVLLGLPQIVIWRIWRILDILLTSGSICPAGFVLTCATRHSVEEYMASLQVRARVVKINLAAHHIHPVYNGSKVGYGEKTQVSNPI
jgi:hypothetical protein